MNDVENNLLTLLLFIHVIASRHGLASSQLGGVPPQVLAPTRPSIEGHERICAMLLLMLLPRRRRESPRQEALRSRLDCRPGQAVIVYLLHGRRCIREVLLIPARKPSLSRRYNFPTESFEAHCLGAPPHPILLFLFLSGRSTAAAAASPDHHEGLDCSTRRFNLCGLTDQPGPCWVLGRLVV